MEQDLYSIKTENGNSSKSNEITISDEDLAAILNAEQSFHIDEELNFAEDSTDFVDELDSLATINIKDVEDVLEHDAKLLNESIEQELLLTPSKPKESLPIYIGDILDLNDPSIDDTYSSPASRKNLSLFDISPPSTPLSAIRLPPINTNHRPSDEDLALFDLNSPHSIHNTDLEDFNSTAPIEFEVEDPPMMASPLSTPVKEPARSLSQLRSALQSLTDQPELKKPQEPPKPEQVVEEETKPIAEPTTAEPEPVVTPKKTSTPAASKLPTTKSSLKAPTKVTTTTPEKKTSGLKPPTPSRIAIPQLSSTTPSNLKTGIPSPVKSGLVTPGKVTSPRSPTKPTTPSPVKLAIPSPTANAKPTLQSPRTLTPRKL